MTRYVIRRERLSEGHGYMGPRGTGNNVKRDYAQLFDKSSAHDFAGVANRAESPAGATTISGYDRAKRRRNPWIVEKVVLR